MSNWTHVSGVIRIDAIRDEDTETPDFDEMFGKEIMYRASSEEWQYAREHPDKYLPFGSEGSLIKTVWVNPDVSSVDAYTVTIFGDLRDHDSPDSIVEWFKNKYKEIFTRYYVRSAVISVENEYNGTKVWSLKADAVN